jgi:ABC-2 type transport system permease protein
MVSGGMTTFGIGTDLAVLTGVLTALVLVTSKLYPSIVR